MSRKRKAGIVTATLPLDQMDELAGEVCILHAIWKREGYRLTNKCRLWRRGNGKWTARFVYQLTTEPGSFLTLTTVVRGIEVA